MESRDLVKSTVREILEKHGISDKDKLDHIPEALASYFGGILTEALMDLNAKLANEDVETFMEKSFYGNSPPERSGEISSA